MLLWSRDHINWLTDTFSSQIHYLTIIPRARMASESWAIESEAMRARGTIVLVKSN